MLNIRWWMASMLCGALCVSQAQAQVNGGGSTAVLPLYQTAGVLTAGFAPYIGVDQGADKAAFLNNDYSRLVYGNTSKNVHWAATESKLSNSQLAQYQYEHGSAWGPLIQVPSAATTVAIPFNKAGAGAIDLNISQLCGIFSGRIVNWGQIVGSGQVGPITLVYPTGSSAMTELLTRFLHGKCSETGTFSVTTVFAQSYSGGLPEGAVAANSSADIMQVLNARDGTITFMAPTYAASTLEGLSDATRVARVGGLAPTPDNIAAAVASIPVPSVSRRADTNAWVPVFTTQPDVNDPSQFYYPNSGYPILGYTNLIFSQCYADAEQTAQVRGFFTRHYGALANNDNAIRQNRLVPLPAAWKTAVRQSFLTVTSGLSIGHSAVCNAIGRPL
ncbi:substrate-binding domain-containing protein [Pseudomonas sp. Au-Pse12]|uniref:substrate-binding domain-containing protein n=1 Tax=Pseudomonas sp. Au-Pse12 TaxID=2906459 RepID=UPI001E45B8E4|nr:substrate-binding domain-containing protein [Pseudomonas sp. Au-Pse12]MCE4053107.1 substrate-binding domain-containing protein [Pseudomonas sp. Au-Pse12]